MRNILYSVLTALLFFRTSVKAQEEPEDVSPPPAAEAGPSADAVPGVLQNRRAEYKQFDINLLVSHIYHEYSPVMINQEALDELCSREGVDEELVRNIEAVALGKDQWTSAWMYTRALTDVPPLNEEQMQRVRHALLLMDTEVQGAKDLTDIQAKVNAITGSAGFLIKHPARETEPVLLREMAQPHLVDAVACAFDLLVAHPSVDRMEALRERRRRLLAAPEEIGASLKSLEESPYFLKLTATIQSMENLRNLPHSAVEARETGENANHYASAKQTAVLPIVQQNQDGTSRNTWLLTTGLILFLIPALLLLLKRRRAL